MTRLVYAAGTFVRGKGVFAASAQTFLASVAILVLNLLTGVVTARFLGVVGRGEQEAMGVWPLFLAQAFTLGLPSALVFNLKKSPTDAPKLFAASVISGLSAGVLAIAVGVVLIPLWLTQHSAALVGSAKVLMLFAPAVLLDEIFSSALRARGDYALYNVVRFLRPLATIAALLTLALLGLLTPFRACLCYLVPSLPISLWLLRRLWRLYKPSWSKLGPATRGLTSYGLRSYGVDLLGALSLQLDKALVVGLLSASSMGLYVVALSLAKMLNVFQAAATTVLFPQASGLSADEAVALAGRTARISTALTVVAAAILGVLGPWALELLYGPEFRGGANLMRLLIIVTIFEGTGSVLAQAFMATDRPGLITLLQGLGLLLNLPLLLVLVPTFGLLGAGMSLLLTSFVRLLVILLAFPRVLNTPPPRLWLNASDLQDARTALRHLALRSRS